MAHDSTDDFVAVAHIIIIITAATALVGANESKGGLGHAQTIAAQKAKGSNSPPSAMGAALSCQTLYAALVIPVDRDPLRAVGGDLIEPIIRRLIGANCRYSFLLLFHVSNDRFSFLSRLNSICKKPQ